MEENQITNIPDEPKNKIFRKPSVLQISILFSIVILLFLMIGHRAQKRELYSGLLITEYGLILLPPLIYLIFFKFDLKRVLRLNKTRALNYLLIFLIMMFAIPIAGIFNLINLWLVNSIFGKIIVQQAPVAENLTGLLVNLFVIGVTAGICEEFLFRGVILRGLERFGAVKAILITAFLFAITHLDFQKLFGTFLLGALIGFIVYRSNSLYNGMFAHFTNNSIVVIMGYLSNKVMKLLHAAGAQSSQSQTNLNDIFSSLGALPKEQQMMLLFIYGFILLILVAIFVLLIYAFIRITRGNAEEIRPERTKRDLRGLWWLAPGVSMVAIIYYIEILSLRGINNSFVETVRRIMGV